MPSASGKGKKQHHHNNNTNKKKEKAEQCVRGGGEIDRHTVACISKADRGLCRQRLHRALSTLNRTAEKKPLGKKKSEKEKQGRFGFWFRCRAAIVVPFLSLFFSLFLSGRLHRTFFSGNGKKRPRAHPRPCPRCRSFVRAQTHYKGKGSGKKRAKNGRKQKVGRSDGQRRARRSSAVAAPYGRSRCVSYQREKAYGGEGKKERALTTRTQGERHAAGTSKKAPGATQSARTQDQSL